VRGLTVSVGLWNDLELSCGHEERQGHPVGSSKKGKPGQNLAKDLDGDGLE